LPSLAGRPLAAVTGASSGIGAVFAEMLAARGMDLIIIARRGDRLEALAKKVGDDGASAQIVVADLTDQEALRTTEALLAHSQIDLLINCAGFGTYAEFHTIDPERIKKELMLDLIVPAALARAVIPGMLARGRGDILNVCSMAGFIPIPRHATYCAAKAGLIRLTEVLHGELAGTGVRVSGVCPGPVPTEFFAISGYRLEDVPPYLLQSATECVDAALRSQGRSKVLSIPHRFVRLFVATLRLLPLGLRLKILGGGPAWLNGPKAKQPVS
jgi:short-subunit dehydrogenase